MSTPTPNGAKALTTALEVDRLLLQEWLGFHERPASIGLDVIEDKARFAEVLADIDRQRESLVKRTREALAPALRASAPIAGADQREAFEAFYASTRRNRGRERAEHLLDRLPDDTYALESTQRHWWTWQNAARLTTPSQGDAPTAAWVVLGPDGSRFEAETPFKAASLANRHRVQVDPVAAKQFADAIEDIRREGEAESDRLLALHGSLNCPACGGSGHVGDIGSPSGPWTGNADADLALILLDRLDVAGQESVRVEQLEGLVRKLSGSRGLPPKATVEAPTNEGTKPCA